MEEIERRLYVNIKAYMAGSKDPDIADDIHMDANSLKYTFPEKYSKCVTIRDIYEIIDKEIQ